MKYLIFFLSFNLFGVNWTNEVELAKGKAAIVYARNCPGTCYRLPSGCSLDVSICTVQDVQVDDPELPLYAAKQDEIECFLYPLVVDEPMQKDDCRKLQEYEDVGTEEIPIVQPAHCTDKTYFPRYAETAEKGKYTAYCTKLLGYEQMTIKRLLVDIALKAAKDAAIAAKDADDTVRLTKAQEFLLRMKDLCLPALNGTPTNSQVIGCLKALMKYTIRKELATGDL